MEGAGLKACGTGLNMSSLETEAPWNGFRRGLGEAEGAGRAGMRSDVTVTVTIFVITRIIQIFLISYEKLQRTIEER